MRYKTASIWFAACMLFGSATVTFAQSRYTVAMRGVALEEALERFVDLTGASLAYEPRLVQGERVYCVFNADDAEQLLRCILDNTRLDFYRLSSGTFTLARKAEEAPLFGRLAGYITEKETGAPVAYAHVSVPEAGIAAATNRSGQFVLPPLLPGPYTLQISHVAYNGHDVPIVLEPNDNRRVEIALDANAVFFTPVIVDASRLSPRTERLEHASALSPDGSPRPLRHAVSSVPGIRMGNVTADLSIQAADVGEQQLRLDGVPIFMPRHIMGLFGPFSGFALASIQVEKAGFGADVGSQISGVADAVHAIRTGKAVDAQADPYSFNSRVEFSLGHAEERRADLAFSTRFRPAGAWSPPWMSDFLRDYSRPDFFLLSSAPSLLTYGRTFMSEAAGLLSRAPDPEITFTDLHAASRVRLGALQSLYLSGYFGRQRLGGSLSDRTIPSSAPDQYAALSVDDEYEWQNYLFQARYDAVISRRSLMSLRARNSAYTHHYAHMLLRDARLRVGAGGQVQLDQLNLMRALDRNRVAERAVEATFDYALNRHHFESGVEVLRTSSGFDFQIFEAPQVQDQGGVAGDTSAVFAARRVLFDHDYHAWRIAGFAQNRISLTDNSALNLGLRLTYLPETGVAYAEPRLSFDLQGRAGFGAWASSTRAGIFRQFVTQHDVSSLDAGSMLPSQRVWLPVDGSVRPPMAYHLSQRFVVEPAPRIELSAEGFTRIQPHALVIDYNLPTVETDGALLRRQRELMADAQQFAAGASFDAQASFTGITLRAGYDLSHVRRRSAVLFDGRWESVPWNDPHRLTASVDVSASPRTVLGLRWQSALGRTWGFRQAYYDYFGSRPDLRHQPGVDLGDPSAHRLPAFHQVDATLAYAWSLGRTQWQGRVEVLNLLGSRNVEEWRLQESGESLRVFPVYGYGRFPSAALRLSW